MLSPVRALLPALLLAPGAVSHGLPQAESTGAEAPAADPVVPDDEPLDQRSCRVAYEIRASLDGETKRLTASETVTWHNRTEDTVPELWFHLYLNAFANNQTVHLLESKGRLRRGGKVGDGEWGWQRVTSLRIGGEELVGSLRFRWPDEPPDLPGDWQSEDRTVFSIPLPEPVPPGGSVTFELDWESQLPRVRRRTGHKDDFLLVAQWFPKLGVYEGGRGWNCHQFHAGSEFYADYGTYDVTLDLPVEYGGKVGASGVLVSEDKVSDEETGAERVSVRFQAPSEADRSYIDNTGKRPLLHDFTWTGDPDYHVHRDTFHFEDWAKLYPSEVERAEVALGPDRNLRLRSVDVTVLVQPERKAQAGRHFKATCAALFFYGLWFGEYPYEHITVVDPAWGGRAAGGMEYPTLFTCGTSLFTTEDMGRPEGVTIHEAGHQFWYGLVGNNEFESAWMDEGFNSFMDSETYTRVYDERRLTTSYSGLYFDGQRPAALPGGDGLPNLLSARRWELFLDWSRWPKRYRYTVQPTGRSGFLNWWRDQPLLTLVPTSDDTRWSDRASYMRDPDSDPVDTWVWEYVDSTSHRTASYPRTAVALRSLSGVVGHDRFLEGMRHYAETWRYRHPYPDDFFEAFIEGSGVDVGWYFEDLFRSTKTVDWSVAVSQRREPKRTGWFQGVDNGEWALAGSEDDADEESEEEADEEPADETAEGTDETAEGEEPKKPGRPWLAEVVVRRKGDLRLPLKVRLTFADGSTEEVVWDREAQAERTWLRIEHEGDSKLKSVILDPDRRYYLDLDMSDNQWYADKDEITPLRWAERVVTQYSHLLQWHSRIGG